MITEAAVDAALTVAYEAGSVPFGPARVRDYLGEATFAEADPEALAALRDADQAADQANREWVRRILTAADQANQARVIAYQVGRERYHPADVSVIYRVP